MNVALPIFPTSYLPPIIYFAYLARFRAIAIEAKETFPKQTYRNRAVLATANGIQTITVPSIRTQGNHTTTEEMEISYAEPWTIKHWRAIETAYNSAPYFLYYKDGLEKILFENHQKLIDLNTKLTEYLIKKLKLNCQIQLTSDYMPNGTLENDYRYEFSSKKPYEKTTFMPYPQVFSETQGFIPNASIIDLLFNLGPDSKKYLENTLPPIS